MLRSSCIALRVLTELWRDRRTLVLILLVPIAIMWLFSIVFSVNSTPTVTLGLVHIDSSMSDDLDSLDHVTTTSFADISDARKALRQGHVDAIVSENGSTFHVIHSNTNSTTTGRIRLGLRTAISKATISSLKTQIATLARQNAALLGNQPSRGTASDRAGESTVHVIESYEYGNADTTFFSSLIPILLPFFVFFFSFLIPGMGLLRERRSGTLGRILATPVRRSQIVSGYLLAYGLTALMQTIVIVLLTVRLLNVQIIGNVAEAVVVNVVLSFAAVTTGMLLSTLAASEFQMVQFIPLVVVPQLFLSGLIPFASLPEWLDSISYVFPLRYAADAESRIVFHGEPVSTWWPDLVVLALFAVACAILNVTSLRRYRKV